MEGGCPPRTGWMLGKGEQKQSQVPQDSEFMRREAFTGV